MNIYVSKDLKGTYYLDIYIKMNNIRLDETEFIERVSVLQRLRGIYTGEILEDADSVYQGKKIICVVRHEDVIDLFGEGRENYFAQNSPRESSSRSVFCFAIKKGLVEKNYALAFICRDHEIETILNEHRFNVDLNKNLLETL